MNAHECAAFDTPPHFAHSQGTEAKCFFHAMRENFCFFFIQGARLGIRLACEVLESHVLRM